MSDDIVTRLYDLCLCCCCGCGQTCSDCEAADEIEDLRAELAEFRRQYTALKALYEQEVRNA